MRTIGRGSPRFHGRERRRFDEHLDNEDGPLVFAHACKLGVEGIVSKRRDSLRANRGVQKVRYSSCAGRRKLSKGTLSSAIEIVGEG